MTACKWGKLTLSTRVVVQCLTLSGPLVRLMWQSSALTVLGSGAAPKFKNILIGLGNPMSPTPLIMPRTFLLSLLVLVASVTAPLKLVNTMQCRNTDVTNLLQGREWAEPYALRLDRLCTGFLGELMACVYVCTALPVFSITTLLTLELELLRISLTLGLPGSGVLSMGWLIPHILFEMSMQFKSDIRSPLMNLMIQ